MVRDFRPGTTPRVRISTDEPSNFILDAHMIIKQVVVVSTAADSGNTPTTKLRAGCTLAKITSTGKYIDYLDGEADGRGTAVGILMDPVNTLDEDAAAVDQIATILIHGRVDDTYVYLNDTAGNAEMKHIIFD